MSEKIVLAYSGGLDTTVIVPWLKENYKNCQVIACCIDVGQVSDYAEVEKKAVNVDIALEYDAGFICHGATGKGNDQIRFELTIKAFAPWLKIIAPWRIWDIKSREEEVEYLKERGIDYPVSKEQNYSRDHNLWHFSHEGLDLEDPGAEPDYKRVLQLSVTPEDAPDKAEYVQMDFEKGVPTRLNGQALSPAALIDKLNEIGARNGIGTIDIVENRVVGLKSRGVYETPGGTIIYAAHKELENLNIDRQTTSFAAIVGQKLAELIYSGEWYTPLREALSAFIDKTQETVTGTVKLKLYKGNIIPAESQSPYSLYDTELASFASLPDKTASCFHSSISFDQRLYKHDINGSIVHTQMLGHQGIISAEDSRTIENSLKEILTDIESGKLKIDPEAEDIHSFIEAELVSRTGDVGGKLHTARSRNDQVALDTRMYVKQELDEINE